MVFRNCSLTLAAVLSAGLLAWSARAEHEADRAIQLHPEKGALGSVKVALFDTSKGALRSKSLAVSDMWLRMKVAKGRFEAALKAPNKSAVDRNEQVFTIEVLSVVNGLIHSDSEGHCSGWSNDVAWCTYGCDGQGFQLKRTSTDFPVRMSILLSAKLPKENPPTGMPPARPLSLTLCGAGDDGDEMLVVPRTGETGQIRFSNE